MKTAGPLGITAFQREGENVKKKNEAKQNTRGNWKNRVYDTIKKTENKLKCCHIIYLMFLLGTKSNVSY